MTELAADRAPVFHTALPLAEVRPAAYNPRFLSAEAFARLQASLQRFGFVKPIIVNGSGVIVAGHQRTKAATALGWETVPAMVLGVNVHTQDEVRFNLLHNSIEETDAVVALPPADGREGYHWIDPKDVTVGDVGVAASKVAAAARLMVTYGAWGSCVVHPATGRVILNADYAVACTQLRLPLLVYYPAAADAAPLAEVLSGEFGVYDASGVAATPYVQNVVQPDRLGGASRQSTHSAVYQQLALPRVTKETRILDFGAGRADYAKRMQKQGYAIDYYEPFTMDRGKTGGFDVRSSVAQLRALRSRVLKDGLYDVIVLDSVLNATSSPEYHDWVLRACAALLAPEGLFCCGTRSLENEQEKFTTTRHTEGTSLSFLAPDGSAIGIRRGALYRMQFHTAASLVASLGNYFGQVEYIKRESATHLALARRPLPQREEELRRALVEEFNPPYPGDYRHARHEPVVEVVLQANRDVGRVTGP